MATINLPTSPALTIFRGAVRKAAAVRNVGGMGAPAFAALASMGRAAAPSGDSDGSVADALAALIEQREMDMSAIQQALANVQSNGSCGGSCKGGGTASGVNPFFNATIVRRAVANPGGAGPVSFTFDDAKLWFDPTLLGEDVEFRLVVIKDTAGLVVTDLTYDLSKATTPTGGIQSAELLWSNSYQGVLGFAMDYPNKINDKITIGGAVAAAGEIIIGVMVNDSKFLGKLAGYKVCNVVNR